MKNKILGISLAIVLILFPLVSAGLFSTTVNPEDMKGTNYYPHKIYEAGDLPLSVTSTTIDVSNCQLSYIIEGEAGNYVSNGVLIGRQGGTYTFESYIYGDPDVNKLLYTYYAGNTPLDSSGLGSSRYPYHNNIILMQGFADVGETIDVPMNYFSYGYLIVDGLSCSNIPECYGDYMEKCDGDFYFRCSSDETWSNRGLVEGKCNIAPGPTEENETGQQEEVEETGEEQESALQIIVGSLVLVALVIILFTTKKKKRK